MPSHPVIHAGSALPPCTPASIQPTAFGVLGLDRLPPPAEDLALSPPSAVLSLLSVGAVEARVGCDAAALDDADVGNLKDD